MIDQYKASFENSTTPKLIVDYKSLQVLDANIVARKIFFLNKEPEKNTTNILVTKKNQQEFQSQFKKAKLKQKSIIGPIKFRTKKNKPDFFKLELTRLKVSERKLIELNFIKEQEVQKKFTTAEMYSYMFDTSKNPFVITDEKYRLVYCNKASENLFQKKAHYIIGKKLEDIYTLIPASSSRKGIREGLNSSGFWEGDVLVSVKSSEPVYNQLSISQIKGKNGTSLGTIGIFKNISDLKNSEVALKKSEKMFRTLYENNPLMNFIVDSNGIIKKVNRPAARGLGYKISELLGKPVTTVFLKEDKQKVLDQIKECINLPGKLFKWEIRKVKKNGEIIWVRENACTVDSNGATPEVLIVCDNITKLKEAESSVRETSERIQQVLDSSPLGVHIYDLNENGELIFIGYNNSANKILAIDHKQFVNKTIEEAFPNLANTEIPDTYRDIAKNGSGFENEFIEYKDKRVKGVFEVSAIQIAPNRMAAFFADVTEKRKANDELKKNQLKYKSLFESANDAIFLMDRDIFIDCNEKTLEIFNCLREDIINAPPYEFSPGIQPDGRSSKEKALERINAALSGKAQFFEWKHKKLDGSLFDAEVSLNKVDLGDKTLLQAIVRDITDRKNAQEKISILAHALKSIHESVCITDMLENIIFVNNSFCKTYNYTAEEIIGKHISVVTSPGNSKRMMQQILPSTLVGGWSGELINVKKGGEEFPVSLSTSVIRDDNGKPIALISVSADITERKKSEQALQSAEQKLREIIEHSSDLFYSHTPDHIITYVSPQVRHFLGCEPEEARTKWTKFVTENPANRVGLKRTQLAIDTGRAQSPYELELKTMDGRIIWVEINEAPVVKDGKTEAIVGALKDITDKKQSEIALERRERFLAALNKSAQILLGSTKEINYQSYVDIIGPASGASRAYIFINHKDEEGEFVSEQIAVWFKKGEKSQDNKSELQNIKHKEVFQRWSELLAKGEIISGKVDEFPENEREILEAQDVKTIVVLPLITKRGYTGFIGFDDCTSNREWEDVELDYLGSAVRNLSQTMERLESDDALRKSEERFRSLIDTMLEAALIIDLSGTILFANISAAKLVGLEYPKQGIGKKVFDFLHPDFIAPVLHVLAKARKKTDPLVDEYKIATTSGEEKWVESLGTRINYEEKISILVTLREITDRKISEMQLKEAKDRAEEMNKIKSNFLANMSHELRTPLVGILGFAEMLKDELTENNFKGMADKILSSGKRLMSTLNSLLDLSRIEANKIDLNFSTVNLEEIVRNQVDLFKAFAERKKLYLKASYPEENIFISVDEQVFRQILDNLINNALKYTDSGGVTVKVDNLSLDSKEFVQVHVKDTGIGIPEESLSTIFQEFRQVSEGFNKHFEGTGLGLTITKRFVRLMGGSISVNSKVGDGSTFTLVFPVVKPGSTSVTIQNKNAIDIKQPSNGNSTSNNLKILVVENDDGSKEVTKLFLKNLCEMDFANNGEEAVTLANENIYDLILMDINLGTGMNGLETTRVIRQINGYQKTPVVALTAFAMRGDKEEFLKAGCTHYMSKPFTKEKITGLIKEISKHNGK